MGKLTLSLGFTIPYFRWKIWKAKRAFRTELLKSGISVANVNSMVESYNRQNKRIFGLVKESLSQEL